MMQGGADQQDGHHGMMGGAGAAGPGMEQFAFVSRLGRLLTALRKGARPNAIVRR
jgi:hypothetical protein